MKRIYYILLLLTTLVSCNDWLDVSPRSESKEKDLYSTEDGFKSSLIGVYINMAQSGLYGKNTTMYLPEVLSRHWTLPVETSTQMYQIANFDYTASNVESLLSTVWSNYYTSIAQLNNLLENIDGANVSFAYGNRDLIKGEALGLRAFLHLDLLRYFGPIPNGADQGLNAIPYVTEMTKESDKLNSIPYGQVVAKIEKDLNDAEELLKNDPIINNTNAALNKTIGTGENYPKDSWQLFRQNRFNYYAVLATKARFYHWIGEKESALHYAKLVIDAQNLDLTAKFKLADESTYTSASDLVMFSENIIGLHNPEHQTAMESLFKGKSATLSQSVAFLNVAYENNINANDIRYKENRYWKEETYDNSVKVNHFLKYIGNTSIEPINTIPLIRLSELYFILIENTEDVSERFQYFQTFRIARNLSASLDDEMNNSALIIKRLEKEYRKEFFGEGQMFFFYKKHEYEQYEWPSPFTLPSLNAYVVTKPKNS